MGKRFRFAQLPDEQKAEWLALLQGQKMEFVHREPLYQSQTWQWLGVSGLGVLGVLGLVWYRLGGLWSPAQHMRMLPLYMLCVGVFCFGLLRLFGSGALRQRLPYVPGRYLLPIGYLDASSHVWRLVSLHELSDVQLKRVSANSIYVAVPTYELSLWVGSQTSPSIHFRLQGEGYAEEVLHVMEHLVDDKERALTGLKERLDAFDALAQDASEVQRSPMPVEADDFASGLPLWLGSPLLIALFIAAPLGGGIWMLRNQIHQQKRLHRALQFKDAPVLRAMQQLLPGASAQEKLKVALSGRYQSAQKQALGLLGDAQKPWVKAFLAQLQKTNSSTVIVDVFGHPISHLKSLQQIQTLTSLKQKRGVASSRPTSAPASKPTFRGGKPLGKEVRHAMLLVRQKGSILDAPVWAASLARAMVKGKVAFQEIMGFFQPKVVERLEWMLAARLQRVLAKALPPDIMVLRRRQKPDLFQLYYLYSQDEGLRLAYDRRKKLKRLLEDAGKKPAVFNGKRPTIGIDYLFWPTGTELEVRSVQQGKSPPSPQVSGVTRLYVLGLAVRLRFQIGTKELHRVTLKVPPIRFMGFEGGGVLGMLAGGSEANKAYGAMVKSQLDRWAKQWRRSFLKSK